MIELIRYQTKDERVPFAEWLISVRDKVAAARIRTRLRQAQAGNLGDCKPVGEGVLELRIHVGPGYRVYCAQHGKTLLLLLCGGDKGTQDADIKQAKLFWADWKRRQHE